MFIIGTPEISARSTDDVFGCILNLLGNSVVNQLSMRSVRTCVDENADLRVTVAVLHMTRTKRQMFAAKLGARATEQMAGARKQNAEICGVYDSERLRECPKQASHPI